MKTKQEIVEKFPEIFKHIKYFECSDGWNEIISAIAEVIQNYIDNVKRRNAYEFREGLLEEVPEIYATQIKEKFGGLRFYINQGSDEIYGAISMAETWSYNTCEVCGERGKIRRGGWMKTLCDKHALEKGYSLDESERLF